MAKQSLKVKEKWRHWTPELAKIFLRWVRKERVIRPGCEPHFTRRSIIHSRRWLW